MTDTTTTILINDAITLLNELIATPSFSTEEDQTAGILTRFLAEKGVTASRVRNNVFAQNKFYDAAKPTILLNSHHDTVRPNAQYTRDPFAPGIADGKLYGLGSNDAGGCLVSLTATFLHFHEQPNLKYNLVLALTAEEEISGSNGIEYALSFLPKIDCAIVGEPTLLQLAVAERGLMVLDCTAHGKAGHAARNEGENALYKALQDIEWIRTWGFEKVSPLVGAVKMSVTVIETPNKTHNIVPAECRFVVDVRVNENYTFEEILDTIQSHIQSTVQCRSMRLRATGIAMEHPLVQSGLALGKKPYGSPTTSDKALMPFPALKVGPGDSARSHTADEFIYVSEIEEGIPFYIALLKNLL
jgi:acetylornithine deacetylase